MENNTIYRYNGVLMYKYTYSRLSPSGQITNAVRSSLRAIFFGPNLFSVKTISKAITNAVRPPFRTTVKFLWQNGKFNLAIAVKCVFSIYHYDHFDRVFLYWTTVTYVFHTCTMRTLLKWQITSLSVGDDNINHTLLWENKIKCSTLTLWLPGRGACQDPDILV